LAAATGAPSRVEAQRRLLIFDLLTSNFKSATAELPEAQVEEKGIVLGLTQYVDDRMKAGDLAFGRGFASWLPAEWSRAAAVLDRVVAGAHVKAMQMDELAAWAKTLPTTGQRIAVYLSVAQALIPKPATPSEF
jgi:hypothetical protein